MRKLLLPIVAVLTVAVVGPTLAGATKGQKKHTCSINLTALFAQVAVNSGSPPISGSSTDAATVDGKLCGKAFQGAARQVTTYPTPGTFTAKTVAFGPLGEIKANASGTGALNADGSTSFSGSGTITGGTGLYKKASGSFSFTGTSPKNSTVVTQHITGTLKY